MSRLRHWRVGPLWAQGYAPLLRLARRPTRIAAAAMVACALCEAVSLAILGVAATSEYASPSDAALVSAAIAGTLILAAFTKAVGEERFVAAHLQVETLLRRQITDAIMEASWEDFVDQPGHELQSAALAEAPQVAQATFAYARGRASAAAAVVVFASTLAVSPAASGICAAFGVAIVLTYRRSTRSLSSVQRELADSNVELTRQTSILIHGLRSLRLAPVQDLWREGLDGGFQRHEAARRRDLVIPLRSRLLVEVLAGLMILVVLLVQVARSGDLLPGLIVMALILRVLPRIQSAQQQMGFARHGALWVQRWTTRLDLLTEAGSARFAGNDRGPAAGEDDVETVLRVDDVGFAFRRHDTPVLSNVQLTLRKGEWVSIRGESGGGKSTLIDIIGGILAPTTGSVSLAGRAMREYTPAERYARLAIVPQDVQLIGDSVRDIVTWGSRQAPAADLATITQALGVDQMFHFDETVDDRAVDEMSRDISGGMRTRLAMARALATNPSVLVLDETTARLHPTAEADIFRAIRTLRPDLAVLVVTHRAETTWLMDRQLELAAGSLQAI